MCVAMMTRGGRRERMRERMREVSYGGEKKPSSSSLGKYAVERSAFTLYRERIKLMFYRNALIVSKNKIELIDQREPASRYLSYSGIKNSLIGASHQQRMI